MSFSPIDFTYLTSDFHLRDEGGVSSWLQKCAKEEQKFIGRLHYHFCSDEELLEMNKTHLKHDYYTDVITFDESRLPLINGDVFISIDRVKDNALSLKQSFDTELYRVIAHGLLHLMGYGDKTEAEALLMREKEAWALKLVH